GMARCRDGLVEVNQYFLRDPGEERLLYEQVLTEMAAADALVSYNGKSYDLPLIRNRCVLNRLDFGWDDLLHLDLLHTVRRLFKSLPSCALTEVETRVLQFRRESDIPGALIPALYFSAVREGDLTALLPVFQHNVMDLLSLIGITAVAAARFERTRELNSADLLAVVRTLSDLGHFEQAERACAAVATGNGDAEWAAVARHHARMHKQRGDWSAAAQIWRRWIEQATRFDPEPYEELAKYLEHRCGELAQALEIVRRAEKHLALLRELHDSSLYFIWNAQLLHRRERLQRKLASMGAST
ncbi:MAG TPA: ribonuclease H-like domain-containing protein, partial [bacterium]|nr:ribonuclease H-like domain-containing protein [bacterium]